jgi:hypothetical protein
MLSISPVSNSVSQIRFGEGPLERKGAYAKPDTETAASTEAPEKKKSHALRNSIIALNVAAIALVALRKTNVLKVLDADTLNATKWYNPAIIGHYLAKAGEAIGKVTVDPIMKLFNKGKAAGVEPEVL